MCSHRCAKCLGRLSGGDKQILKVTRKMSRLAADRTEENQQLLSEYMVEYGQQCNMVGDVEEAENVSAFGKLLCCSYYCLLPNMLVCQFSLIRAIKTP